MISEKMLETVATILDNKLLVTLAVVSILMAFYLVSSLLESKRKLDK